MAHFILVPGQIRYGAVYVRLADHDPPAAATVTQIELPRQCQTTHRTASVSCRRPASGRSWRFDSPYLEVDGRRHRLTAGLLVCTAVKLGSRTVMEYFPSPVRKVVHEAGREM